MNKGVWIACGGRFYKNVDRVDQILDAARERLGLIRLIDGGATGADELARAWREKRGVDGKSYPAAWDDIYRPGAIVRVRSDGKPYDVLAGSLRNARMLEEEDPEGVIAFRGGPGTHDMTKRAEHAGLRVVKIDWEL